MRGTAITARQPQRDRQSGCEQQGAIADLHQRVGVVVLLVEPVTPPVEPLEELLPLVPGPPIELVPPEVPLPVLPAVLPDPEPVPLPEGLVVLEELVEPVPAPEPAVPSRLSQALSERAAATARTAAAH